MDNLPAKTSFSNTSYGVRKRELYLLIGGIGFGIAIILLPFASIFIRIFLFLLICGLFCLLAFLRIEKHWTIEGYLLKRYSFWARQRRFIKGGASKSLLPKRSFEEMVEEDQADQKMRNKNLSPILISLPEYNNGQLLSTILSMIILGSLLAWVGESGIEKAQLVMRSLLR